MLELEPKRLCPKTLRPLPVRQKLLNDRPEPRLTKSNVEHADPKREMPWRLIDDPKRVYDRTDTELPKCKKSKTLALEPNRPTP